MSDFTMPSLGADMDEGTLLEWLVKPGDAVRKGDILAVVDTSKAAVEVESFADGVVDRLVVEPGTRVPVGAVLATLGEPETAAAGEPVPVPAPAEAPAPAAPAEAPVATPGERPAGHPARREPAHRRVPPGLRVSSPSVRREAERLGLDLATITGTGRGGAITRADVSRAAAHPEPAPRRVTPYARALADQLGVDLQRVPTTGRGPVRAADVRAAAAAAPSEPAPAAEPAPGAERVPAAAGEDRRAAMRHQIATVMARSKREIPHYYLTATVDLGRAVAWMRERNRDLPVAERLVPAALLLKATALAAARVPELNGFWVDDAFRPGAGVHVGVAVSLRGGGLVAPALHDADRLDVVALMAGMRDLVTRARAGRLHRAELSDPTLTVTNLGDQGVESVHGVIYPPQVALVGFGRVAERPWAIDGLLGVRPLTVATLAADHRATDGFTGGRFLATVDDLLQHPEDL
ncbi:dihydrolipoamide acetyltransferase family protein [Nocardioides panaciterrulae]|uniref:Dihydrolipoamide acetyltransferase component of pyruvate dehydrogenase complex n=1 Tax=Nocardioides panaciterrulae TaxID=661492 RepID=A0A7Y9E3A3_9ACTN|nr:dihydrolipoamide acetyltransferase family protein [Nocardioides panaciterrulae]NYD40172.1 pyruvate dehydrogenase E2 component (dihydrolipoamide acetyltransferase) [Nocardioides panaciterrulae]